MKSSDLPPWEIRTPEIKNLLNPAFCGELICRAMNAYKKETEHNLPFSEIFLILPLVLHEETRNNLPKNINKNFIDWVNSEKDTAFLIPKRTLSLVPYTRESLTFLFYYNKISISNTGEIVLDEKYRRNDIYGEKYDYVKEFFLKSEFIGKWLAKSGNSSTIYSVLKIRP